MLSFAQRALLSINPTGRRLLMLMEEKQTTLAFSAIELDEKMTVWAAELFGRKIGCLIFSPKIKRSLKQWDYLRSLSEQHQFLLFEHDSLNLANEYSDLIGIEQIPDKNKEFDKKKLQIIERGKGFVLCSDSKQMQLKILDHLDGFIGIFSKKMQVSDPSLIYFSPQKVKGGDVLVLDQTLLIASDPSLEIEEDRSKNWIDYQQLISY